MGVDRLPFKTAPTTNHPSGLSFVRLGTLFSTFARKPKGQPPHFSGESNVFFGECPVFVLLKGKQHDNRPVLGVP